MDVHDMLANLEDGGGGGGEHRDSDGNGYGKNC